MAKTKIENKQIRVTAELHRQLKMVAFARGMSMGDYVQKTLERSVQKAEKTIAPQHVKATRATK